MGDDYKQYVKKGLLVKFKNHCQMNSLDFYSCGCILTAHLVMESLMRHEKHNDSKMPNHLKIQETKMSPKEAWKSAMSSTPYHSGFSAQCTAQVISMFSPRGEEFKKWWKKENE